MDRRSFPDDLLKGGALGAFGGHRSGVAKLARRDRLAIGNTHVDPAARTIAGPGGEATVEPRIMQVLLELADHAGQVVTREALIDQCWGGQIVGDDAINRAISAAHRAARQVSADFEIETISKAGYRLNLPDEPEPAPKPVDRRALLIGGAALALAGTAAVYHATRPRRDPRVERLVERGRQALREDLPDSNEQGLGFLREATVLAPRDAEAWGLLSLALGNVAEYAPVDRVGRAVADCEGAARRALAINADQPDALAALAMVRPSFGDWFASERRLRAILRIAPDHAPTLAALGMLMQSVGRCSDAARLTERAVRLEPLSPTFNCRLAYQLWSSGDGRRADQTIERAAQLWPTHPAVWYAHMLLLGLTGRPQAALALFAGPGLPAAMPPKAIAPWRAALDALATNDPARIAAARQVNLAVADKGSNGAVNAILTLNALGAPDRALAVAEGYLLKRGPFAGPMGYGAGQLIVNNQRWKKTMMLFVPATEPMRHLPGFQRLTADMGLDDYWRAARVLPDYRAALG